MRFKLLVVFVDDAQTQQVMNTAREHGATGSTVINHARGEGLNKKKTFMGLTVEAQRNIVLMVVEEHLSRSILEAISKEAEFDDKPGRGMAIQLDIEDAVGVAHQARALSTQIEEQL